MSTRRLELKTLCPGLPKCRKRDIMDHFAKQSVTCWLACDLLRTLSWLGISVPNGNYFIWPYKSIFQQKFKFLCIFEGLCIISGFVWQYYIRASNKQVGTLRFLVTWLGCGYGYGWVSYQNQQCVTSSGGTNTGSLNIYCLLQNLWDYMPFWAFCYLFSKTIVAHWIFFRLTCCKDENLSIPSCTDSPLKL
jgi:hypothetical protein